VFDSPAEAKAFLAGVEFVNDSACEASIDPKNACVVITVDEDADDDDDDDDDDVEPENTAPVAPSPKMRQGVIYTVTRRNHMGIVTKFRAFWTGAFTSSGRMELMLLHNGKLIKASVPPAEIRQVRLTSDSSLNPK
jgi:hypothetical protein